MATIQLKRGPNANVGSLKLEAGEPAFVLDTGKLYVGNGTDMVLINPDQTNVETATKLKTSRTISLSGDASGSTQFDGSANATITVVLANSGVTAGTYTKLTVDAKGRVTSATQMTAADIPNLTLAKITDAGTAASKNTGKAAGNVPILDSNGKLDAGIMPAITGVVTSVAGKTGVVTLTAADVGLGNVTNESKKTMFTNAALTGSPTAPTQATADNSTKIATTAFVKAQGYLSSNSSIDGGTF